MEVMKVLHMNGGVGETSYASNSLVQRKVISMTRPIMEEAITALYLSILPHPTTLAIADLGCSSGPNTLYVVSEVIRAVENFCREMGHNEPPEYQVFLNDLPGNDFNAIFRALPRSTEKQGQCFFTGVPGSFYDRLFPSKSLHFVHSSYSLQWLSQVPEGLEGNKGNIYMASSSPRSVIDAYFQQFQDDFSLFLKHRAQELVSGGRMVLTILGRRSEDPSSSECCCIWELLAMVLNEMVSEGLIEEEKMDSFNIPQYTPSPLEVKAEVLKEGSFSINRLEVSEVNWSGNKKTTEYNGHQSRNGNLHGEGYSVAMCMRAVAEPMLISHFREGIIEDVFRRYRMLIEDRMAKEKTEFINVTLSLTRNPA
ncbi:salicylate carboxymethyltransferase-like [Punica granatum]|uniref:Salicylate carboxymethyltransferase-like n=4 Tax=Punica granatum TaxID=22663 RepID=A0A6P8CM66_PUNGR|nr:salicylate carboxymethyltransferase-like [Punica granatum]